MINRVLERSLGANMIKIWGRTDSSNVQKVLWCCGEIDLQFDRTDWGGKFGGNKDAAYLEMNPNGLVPTIKDGDFILWESNSIMRYLNAKYGHGRLLPSSPEGMANANRWMDWQLSTFNSAIVPLFWALIRPRRLRKNYNGLADGRRSLGEESLPRRRRLLPGRYSPRCLGLPLV
jgi:glutathione S-transferase